MQGDLLSLVTASPPPQVSQASPGPSASPTGSGPSFENILASRIRDRSSSQKEESANDPSQDPQAQNAASAVAAQQQAQSPQQVQSQPQTSDSAAANGPVAMPGIAEDEAATVQTALQSALNSLVQNMTDAPSAVANPSQFIPDSQSVAAPSAAANPSQFIPDSQAVAAPSATPDPAQSNANAQTAAVAFAQTMPVVTPTDNAAVTTVSPDVSTVASALPAAAQLAGNQQNAAAANATPENDVLKTDADAASVQTAASQTTGTHAADGIKTETQAQVLVAPTVSAKPEEVIRTTPSVKSTEKVSVQDAAPATAALSDAKSVMTLYENKSIDPARLAEGHPGTLTQQVSQGVETMARTGQNSLRLQLFPPDLGRIDLRLTSSSDGVRVSITAEAASTGKLLERNLGDLKQALSNAGVSVLGLSVGQGNTSQQNANHFSDAKAGPVFAASVIPEEGDADSADAMPASGAGDSSYIDYRI